MSNLLKKAMQANAASNSRDEKSDSDSEGESKDTLGTGTMPASKSVNAFAPLDPNPALPFLKNSPAGHPLYFHKGERDIVFFCIHGAGLSARSFTALAESLGKRACLASFDLPGHGQSALMPRGQKNVDFSLKTLLAACHEALTAIHAEFPRHSLIVLGHSLGGSLAARLTALINEDTSDTSLKQQCLGLVVIDVVEGSAKEALPFMSAFLAKRPESFASVSEAVQFTVRSQLVRNLRSARLSMGDQMVVEGDRVHWRTDLRLTEPFWPEWFNGLNAAFLDYPRPKILVLASSDRMDKELTIAQMQGRFKLITLQTPVGHTVHEDDPSGTADQLVNFVKAFRIPVGQDQIEESERVGYAKFDNKFP